MTSPEIRDAIDSGIDTVVFAVGSNEQHGPCLPVSTDTIIGDGLAYAVAEKLSNALKGPTVNMGCSDHHMRFSGTISLRKETLQKVIMDYCESLVSHGFRKIVILPSHGGNFGPLKEIKNQLQRIHPDTKIFAYADLIKFVEILQEMSAKLGVSKEESGAHAGEFEVSMMLWLHEGLVKKDKIPEATGFMGEFTESEAARVFEDGIGALSSIGVLGSPIKASVEHGQIYLEDLANNIAEEVFKALLDL